MTTQPHDNPLVLPPLVSSPASPQFCQEGQRQPTLVPEAGGGSRPLRVLFMHGLESGPRGRRAMDMSRHFECYTPWMRNELEPLLGWWRNRTVRVCIALFIFLVVATAGITYTAACRFGISALGGLAIFVVGLVAVCFGMRSVVLTTVVRPVIHRCLQKQRKALLSFKPDVVVGTRPAAAI
jgi:hypothetical protein